MRGLAADDVLRGAGDDDAAAGVAAFRAEIDHVIGCLDHVHVVLDQQHGMPGVHKAVQ